MNTLDIDRQRKLRKCILLGVSNLVLISCILCTCASYINDVRQTILSTYYVYVMLAVIGLSVSIAIMTMVMSFFTDPFMSSFRYIYMMSAFLAFNMLLMYASARARNKHMVPVAIGISILVLLAMTVVGLRANDLTSWGGPLSVALIGAFVSQLVLFVLMYTTNIPFDMVNVGLNILSGVMLFVFTMFIAYDINMFVKQCDKSFKVCCQWGTFAVWEDFTSILLRFIRMLGDTQLKIETSG